jgi:two-component system, NarL family, response regulator DevR
VRRTVEGIFSSLIAEVVEWQTRTFEGRVAQAVRVQVPPSAPTYACGAVMPPASATSARRRSLSSTKSSSIRLLLVDDHEVVRVGLRTVLHNNQGITVVGEADSKARAAAEAKRLRPDVILMDVRLPDGSGVEACREILSDHPESRVIFLTSYTDDDSVLAAVLAGAYGYVLKEIDSAALIRAIRTVSAGRSILDPAVAKRALEWIKTLPTADGPPRTSSLSPQEERVLALVAEGLTNKEIASSLQLSDKTVKNYLANMFQKLHISRRAQAAAFFVKRTV